MTRVDFYFNASDRFEVITRLLSKAVSRGFHILVYTQDDVRLQKIDHYLWHNPLLSFLPHVRSEHPLAGKTPIVIGSDPGFVTKPDIIINLDDQIPDCFSRFTRLLEVVTEDKDDRDSSRERFRFFKQRGYVVNSHDLKAVK